MSALRTSLIIPAILFLVALPALSQSVISAQSGLVHFVEGRVYIGDTPAEPKSGEFPQLKEKQVLRTEEGRAELLLNPGVFLRVAENSSVRMLSTRLTDSRVEFLGGSVLVEATQTEKGSAVTVFYKDTMLSLVKSGIYRLDSEPGQFRVFEGEAMAEVGSQKALVKKGKLLALDGTLLVQRFNPELTDAFDRWSHRRGEYIAMANISAAKSIADRGFYWGASGWFWNPYFGMFTFVPVDGVCRSAYGYRFWSPERVYAVYYRPSPSYSNLGSYNPSLGYTTIPSTSTGNSGTLAVGAAAPTTSTTSSTAPIVRDSGRAGGRER